MTRPRESRHGQEHRASIFSTSSPILRCSGILAYSPPGLILNKINSNLRNLRNLRNLSNLSNLKPDPCLVSQARLALEQGEEVCVIQLFTRFAFIERSLIISTQLLDRVEGLAKIHNNSLSKRTRCLETLHPILILRLRQEARRLVCLLQHCALALLLVLHQGRLGAITIIRQCLVTLSPPQGSARLEEDLQHSTRVVGHLVRQIRPSRSRQIQACLDNRMRLGARLGEVHLQTNQQQALSDQRLVCHLVIFLI